MTAGIVTRSAEATERLGEQLAPALEDGDIVVLSGDLGAGKTRFVMGLARGLACRARVRSPSFAIVNEYAGRRLLIHLDLYRLEPGEAEGLGLDEYLERGALAVEWGERLPTRWRSEALTLRFEAIDEHSRRVTAEAGGARARALLEAWTRAADAAPAPASGHGAGA